MTSKKNRSRFRRLVRMRSADSTSVPVPGNVAEILANGQIIACQELPWGSNYTFAVAITTSDDEAVLGVYKPRRGEVPLWDFPSGTLYRREYASFLFCTFLGWDFIPTTVIRDGPFGIGTVQLYLTPDESVDFDRLLSQHLAELQRIAVFDLIANNADRKLSHLLLDKSGKLWGIDHGLTFNTDPKLRTVLLEFGGQPIPSDIQRTLKDIAVSTERLAALRNLLTPHLAADEIEITIQRLQRIAAIDAFPVLDPRRHYPRGFW